jgi:flavodoxin I
MKKIGLFYGSTAGKTRKVAEMIKTEFDAGSVDLHDIKDIKPKDILKYDNLIFGTSAWGVGDMQDDWETFIDDMVELDLSKKKIALYGLGDQEEYPGSFVDGLGTLYCRMPDKDNIVGFTSTEGYTYYFSSAEMDGRFVGLAIDEDKQSKLTPQRVKKWVAQLKKEFQ